MFKILKFIKGKALVYTIIGLIFVMGAAYLDASQPTFLNDAISSLSFKTLGINFWWGGQNGASTWHIIGQNGHQIWAFWPAIIMMAIYAFGSLISGLSGAFLGSAASLYASMNTRQGMYDKIQTYSFKEVDKFSPASLITRISNDVNKHQMSLQMILTLFFRTPVTLTISIINAFTPPMGRPMFGFITLGIIGALLLVILIIASFVLPLFTKSQTQLDETNKIMRENILGARIIKTFNIQNMQHERYKKQNKKLKDLNIRGQAMFLPVMSMIMFLLNAGVVIILITAGIQFINPPHTSFDAGIFAFTQLIAIVLFNSIMMIYVIIVMTRTYVSIKRINAVIDTNSSIIEKPNSLKTINDYSIEFHNVDFKYSQKTKEKALNNINFKIPSGKTLGIVGGTGSGKTTIANLIARFYDTTSGSVKVGGVDVKDIATNTLIDNISIVLQDSILLSGTIESNLKCGKQDATEQEMVEACENSCAWEFVQQLPNKFNNIVEQRGRNFSGGQKQRISLARSLIKKPNILILDDTTSALDLLTEAKVQENLNKNFANTTKLIISQRISSIQNADKIIVLDNGKIIGEGTHNELIKSCKDYQQIVSSQLGSIAIE